MTWFVYNVPDEPDVYYFDMLEFEYENNDGICSCFYRLLTDMTNDTLEVRVACYEYTLACKNGTYKFKSVKPVNTEIFNIIVCKHKSVSDMKLSVSEKKGTLKVGKAVITIKLGNGGIGKVKIKVVK